MKSMLPSVSFSTACSNAPYTVPASWRRSTKTPLTKTKPRAPSLTVIMTLPSASESSSACCNLYASFSLYCSSAQAARPRLRSPGGAAMG